MSNGDLLTPSLTDASRMPIFSVNAMIAAAFFGGAFAVPLLAMENSRRLARLHRDAPVLVLGLLIAAAALLFTVQSVGALGASESRSEFRLISRGIYDRDCKRSRYGGGATGCPARSASPRRSTRCAETGITQIPG
jgi:hypothetical protein